MQYVLDLSSYGLQVKLVMPAFSLFNYVCTDKEGRQVFVVVRKKKPFTITQKKIERLKMLEGKVYFILNDKVVDMQDILSNPQAYRKQGVYITGKKEKENNTYTIKVPRSKKVVLRISCSEELKKRFNILKINLGINSETLLQRAIDVYDRYSRPLQKPIQTGPS